MRVFDIFVKKCEAILKDVVLLPCTISLNFGILYLKKSRLTGTVVQELTLQSKIHEQSIHSTATLYGLRSGSISQVTNINLIAPPLYVCLPTIPSCIVLWN